MNYESIKHSGFQRYFNNTAWLILDKIFRLISSLVVGVWLARHLGAANFGILSYSQSYIAIFASLATLGLDSILTRELVSLNDDSESLLGTTLVLKLLSSISIVIVIVFLQGLSIDQTSVFLITIISLSLVFKSFDVFAFFFQANVKSKSAAISGVFTGLISSGLKITGIILNLDLSYFAYIILLDSILYSVFLISFIHRKNALILYNLKFRKNVALRVLKDSWPLLFGGLVVSVSLKMDQVIISNLLGNEAVGKYAAAVRISEAWFFIPAAIAASLFPAIINAKKKGAELYVQRIQKLYSLLTIFSIITAMGISVTSPLIIEFLYGSEFIESASVLRVHVWAGVFVTMSIANGNWLISENLQKYYLINMTIGALLNVILNMVLIPKYGIIASAWINLITYIISAYFSLLLFEKTRMSFIYLSKSFLLSNLLPIQWRK